MCCNCGTEWLADIGDYEIAPTKRLKSDSITEYFYTKCPICGVWQFISRDDKYIYWDDFNPPAYSGVYEIYHLPRKGYKIDD